MLIWKRVLFFACVIITSNLTGCVSSGSNIDSGIYHPTIQPGNTVNQAVNNLLYLVGTNLVKELKYKCGYATAQDGSSLTIVKSAIENNRLILTYRAYNFEGVRTLDFNLTDLIDYNVVAENKHVPLPIGIKFRCDADIAKKIADALYMIKWHLETTRDDFSRNLHDFEPVAAQYRELDIKPQISEEQRRLIVQANSLTEQKQYIKALEKYRQAIALDPVSSPESYFNMALLEAQLNMPFAAITYMKQYLMLVPDAPDVRSAQDKIYEWELLMPNTKTAAGASRPERGYLGVRFENPSQGKADTSVV